MTTLACRHLAKDCLETLTAADSKEIQKVFLDHIHARHQGQWNQYSRQFKTVSLVTMRDRFDAQKAEDQKTGIVRAAS